MKYTLLLFLALTVCVFAGDGGKVRYSSGTRIVAESESSEVHVIALIGGKRVTPSPYPPRNPSPSVTPSPSPSAVPSPVPSPSPSPSVVPSPVPSPSPSVVPSPVPSPSPSVVPSPVPSPSPSPKQSPSPSPEPEYPVDYSTKESSLRTAIFEADIAGAAKLLSSSHLFSAKRGLTFPPEYARFVVKSEDRNQDPDVIAFKALAKAALDEGDPYNLATAVVMSFQPDCQCSVFSSEEEDKLRSLFAQYFMNTKQLKVILYADANQEEDYGKTGRRLELLYGSAANSFVCAHCWPKKQCKSFHWCKK